MIDDRLLCVNCKLPILTTEDGITSPHGWIHKFKNTCSKRMAAEVYKLQNSHFDKQQIGNATLYCGDCADILPSLPQFDLLLTDPPYGLGKKMQGGTWGAKEGFKEMLDWDNETPNIETLQNLINKVDFAIIWGGNYYPLPVTRCLLSWNKINAVPTMADFELAWTNFDKPSKRWDGLVGRVEFGHPTQKPIGLMHWCLDMTIANTVLDPFMGSGTTGVACAQAGKEFTGIERERKYFDIACKRIEAAQAQGKLFAPEIIKPVQESMI